MRLKITNIREKGDLNKERIVMQVEAPGNVGEFVINQCGFSEGSVTNIIHRSYWFPDRDVKEGDFVVLYTKHGTNSEKPFKDVTSHFFYWGIGSAIWNTDDRSAVLMYAPDWEAFKPDQF